MKTTLRLRQFTLALVITFSLAFSATAQSGLSNGLNFQNPTLVAGTDNEVGAKYLFSNVDATTDAVVTIDSIVNDAEVNKIDDNSNGTGYREAFQPAIKNGGNPGMSYAVFTISFYHHGSMTSTKIMSIVNATALDIDGNNNLKEFAKINMGHGSSMSYMNATPDISVERMPNNDLFGQNILGEERVSIDTSALNNMYTASNNGISSFTIKYGSISDNNNQAVRQYSLYLKKFEYNILPVKMSSFSAILNNNKVDLRWITASEMNLSHFSIERSVDGINYTEAGLVFAVGNSNENISYKMSDNITNLAATVVYYRVRSVDIDSKSEVSEVKVIRLAQNDIPTVSIVTYPNPVTNELRITIPNEWQNKKVTYELVSANGQLAKRVQVGNSSQTETVNVSTLAPGFYVARVICEGKIAQQKVVKN
jgi:hypothetical protein